VVTYADPYAKYGNLVVIAHDKKGVLTTHYGHLSEIRTVIGKKVKAGELIGAVGRTGGATGPHLHFEIRINGKPQDPGELLPMLSDAGAG
jgi:murein DD-endopeptidase MepM/ murein hydrolase activator NlpD